MPRDLRSFRRPRLRALLIGAALAFAAIGAATRGQQPPLPRPVSPSEVSNRTGRQVSLKDQLRVGLKAVTPADLAFLDHVVLKVNDGTLPRELVDSTFLWARNRYKTRPGSHRLRPIVYFQPALVTRAKKIGVVL